MYSSMKYILYLLWCIVLYCGGILIFTRGFLLTRFVITDVNNCRNVSDDGHSRAHYDCVVSKPKHKKAVLLIIDALRYDFLYYNAEISKNDELPYQNKLVTINDILQNHPRNSRLYHFIADPPTTTLQRLKGLTTGSLPTFIDIASNFDSSAVSEDNIISQFVRNNISIVFMGDDTWTSIFPSEFKRSFPYPSFNTKDLHLVDNGVIEHLQPELAHDDWDVLIAHFLGVDHCGHRYGPNHPAMAEKLIQMDHILKGVIEKLDEETILFVLGDHGMTRTGDHGGDSWDELNAGLFVYSPSALTDSPYQKQHPDISQIDLVPTLSLLLGTEIPFSNLGSIIPDLFNQSSSLDSNNIPVDRELSIIAALETNARQVENYITAYAKASGEFPTHNLRELETVLDRARQQHKRVQQQLTNAQLHADLLENLMEVREIYTQYLTDVKTMCQKIWAKFDVVSMVLGLSLIFGAVVLNVSVIFSLGSENSESDVRVTQVLCSVWWAFAVGVLSHVQFNMWNTALVLILAFSVVPCIIAFRHGRISQVISQGKNLVTSGDLLATIIVILYCLSLFSNSYIVYEDMVCAYILQSLIVYKGYNIIVRIHKCNNAYKTLMLKKPMKTQKEVASVPRVSCSPFAVSFFVIVACLLVRLSANFRVCREEQWTCEENTILRSLYSLSDDLGRLKTLKYFSTVGLLLFFPIIVKYWLRKNGNMNSSDIGVWCVKLLLPLGCVFLALYWALQTLPRHILDGLPLWQATLFPQLVYATVILIILGICFSPLSVYTVERKSHSQPLVTGTDDVVKKLYNHLKTNWRTEIRAPGSSSSNDPPPLVYGLATVYSTSVIILLSAVVLLLFLLLGDGLVPSLMSLMGVMFCLLELHATHQTINGQKAFTVPWSTVVLFGMLASEHFFSTAHQTIITTIQWQSAFHGFQGDFDYYIIPAVLIGLNTFASHVVCVLGLPLLLFWPLTRGQAMDRSRAEASRSKGEYEAHEDPESLRKGMARLLLRYILLHGLKVCAVMGCDLVHRRHLMVWKIFAPRFLFEAVTFFIVALMCFVVYLFVLRVDHVLSKWVKKLEKSA